MNKESAGYGMHKLTWLSVKPLQVSVIVNSSELDPGTSVSIISTTIFGQNRNKACNSLIILPRATHYAKRNNVDGQYNEQNAYLQLVVATVEVRLPC